MPKTPQEKKCERSEDERGYTLDGRTPPPEESWKLRLGQLVSQSWAGGLWHSEATLLKSVKDFVSSEREKAFIEGKKHALETISEGQGWEESYDLYAEKLGLPKKNNK